MPDKPVIESKFAVGTKVKIRSGQDKIIGKILDVIKAPAGHIARNPGDRIYLIKIEWQNGKDVTDNLVTTVGEHEIIAYTYFK